MCHKQTFTLEQIELAEEEMVGFCTACGEESDFSESDAQGDECSSCGEHQVYGAGELMFMGLVG